MWLAKAGAYRVVVLHLFMEGSVGSKDCLWEAFGLQDVLQEGSLDLVEALPDVSAAPPP